MNTSINDGAVGSNGVSEAEEMEPVFGNLRDNKHLCRFSLRGQQKVDGQWKLYCLMHNIEKLAPHGYGRVMTKHG